MHLGNNRVGSPGSSQSSLETVLWDFLRGWRAGCGRVCVKLGDYFGVILGELSCQGMPSTPHRLQKTMPSFSQVKKLLEISMLRLWVALPVLLLCVAHSAAFVKWLTPPHGSPVFSLSATWQLWHTKRFPWKAAPPTWHRYGTVGLGPGGRPQGKIHPSGLCQPRCVTAGGIRARRRRSQQPGSPVGGTALGRQGLLFTAVPSGKGCSAWSSKITTLPKDNCSRPSPTPSHHLSFWMF